MTWNQQTWNCKDAARNSVHSVHYYHIMSRVLLCASVCAHSCVYICVCVCVCVCERERERESWLLKKHCQHWDYTALDDTIIMNVEQLVEWKVARETKVLRENLSQFNIKKDDVIIKVCQIYLYTLSSFPRM
jgi:hypothetical protein